MTRRRRRRRRRMDAIAVTKSRPALAPGNWKRVRVGLKEGV